jgi:hypothetical protein
VALAAATKEATMFPTDPTGELTRQRIADLHAEAARQRLARSVPVRPTSRATTLRQLVTVVVVAAVLVAVVLVQFVP